MASPSVRGPTMYVLLLLHVLVISCAQTPPKEIMAPSTCTATCVFEKHSGYPCPYNPTYPVQFDQDGSFSWRAPYANGSAVEIGVGQILTPVQETHDAGSGHWQAQWFGGNHLLQPASLHHVTHCACYYAQGTGPGKAWFLSNYGVAVVPNSAQIPLETVCGPHYRSLGGCPDTNASAYHRWGPPWIEAYEGCTPNVLFM